MLSKYDNCTHLFKIKNKLKIGCCYKNNFLYFVGIFNKTIILLALVGYEMIIANSYPMPTRGIIVKYTVKIKKITVSGPFIVKTP